MAEEGLVVRKTVAKVQVADEVKILVEIEAVAEEKIQAVIVAVEEARILVKMVMLAKEGMAMCR